jgi:hypothetical protein
MTMRKSQVALILTKCAQYDRRTIGENDSAAWLEVIGDLDFEPAITAVVSWYRTHREWIMPSDIRDMCGENPLPGEFVGVHGVLRDSNTPRAIEP